MFEGSGRLDPTATFPALSAAIAAVALRPDRGLGSSLTVLEEARALLVLRRQLDARLLARVAAVDEQGLAAADGFASTSSWVRAFGNYDSAQAGGLVAAARLADRLPALGGVLAAGKVGVEHLQAVASGASRTPTEILAVSDQTLATLGPHACPSQMRRAAQAIQASHDHTAAENDPDYAHSQRHLSLSRTFGDAVHLAGLLDPLAGAALTAALEPLMAKRGPEDDRTPGQRRADALTELIEIALRSAALPDCGGDRPRVTFLVRTAQQADRFGVTLGAAGSLGLADIAGAVTGTGSGARFAGSQPDSASDAVDCSCGRARFGALVGVSAHTGAATKSGLIIGTQTLLPWAAIGQLVCDAELNVAAVNDWGEILNYGRTRRLPTPAQRRALTLRDQGCVFPGCDRSPSACQAHHLGWWSFDGPTDLDNLALVCRYHHQLVHAGWQLQRLPPGQRTPDNPDGSPGWQATGPQGQQHQYRRQPAA